MSLSVASCLRIFAGIVSGIPKTILSAKLRGADDGPTISRHRAFFSQVVGMAGTCAHSQMQTRSGAFARCAKIQLRADSMKRDEVISKLRAHEAELKAAGIVRLAVFGSVARGDDSPGSDVDLLADFDETKRYTLLTMGRLESRLSDLLGTGVDLSSPEWLKESVKNQVLREAVFAF